MTEITNYGPLAGLTGIWVGHKGTDIAPEVEGEEVNEYYETITFTEAGDVSNAEEQTLSALHYVLTVQRITNNKTIHQETGYWMWDQATNQVMHSLVIPRGICVLAGGEVTEQSSITFVVSAEFEKGDWQLIQSPFMLKKAKLISYQQQLVLQDNVLSYQQTMLLDIYGKQFEHTDKNTLQRQN